MWGEIVPYRLGFRTSVHENDGHREFLPKQLCRTTVQSIAPPPVSKRGAAGDQRAGPPATSRLKVHRAIVAPIKTTRKFALATAGIGGARTLGSSGFPTRQGQKQSYPACRLLAPLRHADAR